MQPKYEDRRLLRRREIAEYLGLSERSVSAMQAEGLLEPIRLGRSVRFDIRDAEKLIEARKKVSK